MATRLRRVAARCGKRFLSILLILAFLTGTVPVPVVTRALKDRSQPFPCQDNPCGCSTADECWHHCCCHTNTEKLAWAREHGVTPPSYVVEAAEKEGEPERTCCHRAKCKACAAKTRQVAEESTAEESSDETSQDEDCQDGGHHNHKGKLATTLVLSDLARRCHGLSPLWSLISDALPVRIKPVWAFDARIVGCVIDAPVLDSWVELSPPVPPPKLCG